MRVEPGHVYVISPNTRLGIRGGRLTLSPRPDDPKVKHLPVDAFFRELAAERGSRAIGIVLSGTASDGTDGLQAIKEANGITFAQEPALGEVRRNAPERGRRGRRRLLPPDPGARAGARADQPAPLRHRARVARRRSTTPATLEQIIALVRTAARVDFGEYKSPTFERRLARRMALRRMDTIGAYLHLLQQTPEEVWALFEDTLIHVTSFFRDPEVFEHLKADVFPAIVKGKPEGAPIRVWVPGCATGEEVYSLGIALVEYLGESSRPIQIFGSDVSSKAIETCRAGLYLGARAAQRRRREAQAVLHESRSRLSDRPEHPGAVRLRAARSRARSAVLEGRSGELPQRSHLLRRGAPEARRPDVPLRPEPTRVSPPRSRGEHLGLQRSSFSRSTGPTRSSREPRCRARSGSRTGPRCIDPSPDRARADARATTRRC